MAKRIGTAVSATTLHKSDLMRSGTRLTVRGGRRSKFNNVKTTVAGLQFDSKKEAEHYLVLKAREAAGDIAHLVCQPQFPIAVFSHAQIVAISTGDRPEPRTVSTYVADFSYYEAGRLVVEDVKSAATRKLSTYRLKKKMVEVLYGIDIIEI